MKHTRFFKTMKLAGLVFAAAFASLWAVESSEKIRILIDDIEVVHGQDSEAGRAYQQILTRTIQRMGRFDLITPESIKEKIQIKAKSEAGLELSDADLAKAASLAGAKFLIRARLSEISRSFVFTGDIPHPAIEAKISIRLIDIETVTAIGSLRYRLKNQIGITYPGMIIATYGEFQEKLNFDLKGLLLLQANVKYENGILTLDRGKSTGVTWLTRFKLFRNERMPIENEFGEKAEEVVRIPIGDLRAIRVDSNQSLAEMRRTMGRFSKDMTAIEWNMRNIYAEVSLGFTTFSTVIKSNNIGANSFGEANATSNYFLQIHGTEAAIFDNSRLNLGATKLSPFANFEFGWNQYKIGLFGRINMVLTSPLVSVSLDPGIRLQLIETGLFNLNLNVAGKFGLIGGKIGALEFKSQQSGSSLNHIDTAVFGSSVPLGAYVQMFNFFIGASATANVGFNIDANNRVNLMVGYEYIPDITPKYYLDMPATTLRTLPSFKEVPSAVATAIGNSPVQMSRFLFGLNYSVAF
ncbi:MAG: hypothetical protein JNM63_05500 [Spirochaetia bacterium]|nr:hypothetical protein [Spirochaetia bacterium]